MPNMDDAILEALKKIMDWACSCDLSCGVVCGSHGPIEQEVRSLVDLAQREAQPKWEPIETAPRDGTEILICVDGEVHEARYDELHPGFPWVFIDDIEEALTGCCDREATGRVNTNGACAISAWMPLPPAPRTSEEG